MVPLQYVIKERLLTIVQCVSVYLNPSFYSIRTFFFVCGRGGGGWGGGDHEFCLRMPTGPSRLLSIRLKAAVFVIIIIQVYAPRFGHNYNEVDHFY